MEMAEFKCFSHSFEVDFIVLIRKTDTFLCTWPRRLVLFLLLLLLQFRGSWQTTGCLLFCHLCFLCFVVAIQNRARTTIFSLNYALCSLDCSFHTGHKKTHILFFFATSQKYAQIHQKIRWKHSIVAALMIYYWREYCEMSNFAAMDAKSPVHYSPLRKKDKSGANAALAQVHSDILMRTVNLDD